MWKLNYCLFSTAKEKDCGKGFQLTHDLCLLVIRRVCYWISQKQIRNLHVVAPRIAKYCKHMRLKRNLNMYGLRNAFNSILFHLLVDHLVVSHTLVISVHQGSSRDDGPRCREVREGWKVKLKEVRWDLKAAFVHSLAGETLTYSVTRYTHTHPQIHRHTKMRGEGYLANNTTLKLQHVFIPDTKSSLSRE